MPKFHETGYGRAFYGKQLPDLIKAINRVATALEVQSKKKESEKEFSFADYVQAESKRQWEENQAVEHGSWESQADDTKAEYYNQIHADKLSEANSQG